MTYFVTGTSVLDVYTAYALYKYYADQFIETYQFHGNGD